MVSTRRQISVVIGNFIRFRDQLRLRRRSTVRFVVLVERVDEETKSRRRMEGGRREEGGGLMILHRPSTVPNFKAVHI